MPHEKITTDPVWTDHTLPRYPALDADLKVDVVVVGGGITGVTAAYLLHLEGVRVALIERDTIACGDTSRSTAHLTYVTDERLHRLVRHFGREGARAFWDAGSIAIEEIARIARHVAKDCEFTRVEGYLHPRTRNESAELRQDADLAASFGFDAALVDRTALFDVPAIRFANQARFHPLKYLAGLLHQIADGDSHVFEQTAFESVQEEPFAVKANGRTIQCDYVVLATHNPLMGRSGALAAGLFQTKLALYSSYVVGAKLPKTADALYWDTSDPYDYLRIDAHADHAYAIFGGADVKTGQEHDVAEIFREREARLLELFPAAEIDRRWQGQVIETDDGLPFIGENASRQFIATGFSGNGMTLGTFAAMMARDRFVGRQNAFADLFRVDRSPHHGGLWQYAKENVDFPYHFVRERLTPAAKGTPESLRPGEGKILDYNGEKVAAFRDDDGTLSLCSALCTHLKCVVRWNGADRTWDCPCHGSRFHPTGEVLSGPAETSLPHLSK